MAGKGLRYPYYAVYNYTPGTGVSYSNGGLLGGAVEMSAKINSADSDDLWADDGPKESDRTFAGGTLSITTDDLDPTIAQTIFGLKTRDVTVDGKQTKELVFDDAAEAPYLGVGIIIPKSRNRKPCFRAVVFLRVMFSVPEDAGKTYEGKTSWQTNAMEANILRSEADGEPWKVETEVPTEAMAKAYIEQTLNIASMEKMGSLNIASAAGTATGSTKLTVVPTKTTGNSYRYKVAATEQTVTLNQTYPDWTTWDGAAEITAPTGQKLTLIETDATGKAKKSGSVTVTAKA